MMSNYKTNLRKTNSNAYNYIKCCQIPETPLQYAKSIKSNNAANQLKSLQMLPNLANSLICYKIIEVKSNVCKF